MALKNGNLVLAFDKSDKSRCYRFNRDAKANWFGYTDCGASWYSVEKDNQNFSAKLVTKLDSRRIMNKRFLEADNNGRGKEIRGRIDERRGT